MHAEFIEGNHDARKIGMPNHYQYARSVIACPTVSVRR